MNSANFFNLYIFMIIVNVQMSKNPFKYIAMQHTVFSILKGKKVYRKKRRKVIKVTVVVFYYNLAQ